MLRPRIIPCLLIRNDGLVKTVRFSDPKYVGDPINAVRIFNEKEVDELMVLDIDATARGLEPNYTRIEHLASECRMPFSYGGGIRTVEQIQRIIRLGVEKVAVSAALFSDRTLVPRAAARVGSQSIVAVLDVRKAGRGYEIFTHNGTRGTGLAPEAFAKQMESEGIGEIVVNAIDQDGAMKGYDLELADRVRAVTTVPLTVLGGAGTLDHVRALISRFGIVGAAAGSLFVFKGVYRAVLINYPRPAEKRALAGRAA